MRGNALTVESEGFIGERFDPETGLHYLNARYYDPELGLFIQPLEQNGSSAPGALAQTKTEGNKNQTRRLSF